MQREIAPKPNAFRSFHWCRNVLNLVASAREKGNEDQYTPSHLVVSVALDMALYADQNGMLFRSEEETCRAVGASPSHVRDARKWLVRVGLAEVSQVSKIGPTSTKGRKATTFRLQNAGPFRPFFGPKQKVIDKSYGRQSDIISADIGAEMKNGISADIGAEMHPHISAPKPASITAPMGANTEYSTHKGAGARVNAPPSPKNMPDDVIDPDAGSVGDIGAHERPPSPDPEDEPADYFFLDASDPTLEAKEEDIDPADDHRLFNRPDLEPPECQVRRWAEEDAAQSGVVVSLRPNDGLTRLERERRREAMRAIWFGLSDRYRTQAALWTELIGAWTAKRQPKVFTEWTGPSFDDLAAEIAEEVARHANFAQPFFEGIEAIFATESGHEDQARCATADLKAMVEDRAQNKESDTPDDEAKHG
jgi:hypothetical protein